MINGKDKLFSMLIRVTYGWLMKEKDIFIEKLKFLVMRYLSINLLHPREPLIFFDIDITDTGN